MNSVQRIEVTTDHYQFLFGDSILAPLVDTTDLWSRKGRIATIDQSPELVGIGVRGSDGIVTVEVVILQAAPADVADDTAFGSFNVAVPSGRLVFWGPEQVSLDDAPTISVPTGTYSALAFEIGSASENDGSAAEQCVAIRLVMWPAILSTQST